MAIYINSLPGVLLYDDIEAIVRNPSIRKLWPLWEALWPPRDTTAAGRPILNLSLAVNYAISGLQVWSYHLFNMLVHVLCGIALFGIVRRTLLAKRLRGRFAAVSFSLALVVSLIWLVHPLNTESVTYVIQRGESLMGLFYLCTLYCAMRSYSSPEPRGWQIACVAACALGMGTKEVMVSALLVVVLHDKVFQCLPFGQLLGERWRLYAGLAATWVILALLVATNPRGKSVGFDFADVTPIDYAMTQFGVIAFYLRLALWPDELCIDHAWPIARNIEEILPGAIVVGLLVLATALALWRAPAWGFLGAWFFLILAPSSSILPIVTEVAAEHRMYLPLAAVVAAVVFGAYLLGAALRARVAAFSKITPRVGKFVPACLVAVVVAALSYHTAKRNTAYYSAIRMWSDVVKKRPRSHGGLLSLGYALERAGRQDEAVAYYQKSIQTNPTYASAYNNLGVALKERGELDAAIAQLRKALQIDPDYAQAHSNLGLCYKEKGDLARAIGHLERSTQFEDNLRRTGCFYNLGLTLLQRDEPGDLEGAIRAFEGAIRTQIDPDAVAHFHLSRALIRQGKIAAAIRHLERAVAIRPNVHQSWLSGPGTRSARHQAADGEPAQRTSGP